MITGRRKREKNKKKRVAEAIAPPFPSITNEKRRGASEEFPLPSPSLYSWMEFHRKKRKKGRKGGGEEEQERKRIGTIDSPYLDHNPRLRPTTQTTRNTNGEQGNGGPKKNHRGEEDWGVLGNHYSLFIPSKRYII